MKQFWGYKTTSEAEWRATIFVFFVCCMFLSNKFPPLVHWEKPGFLSAKWERLLHFLFLPPRFNIYIYIYI